MDGICEPETECGKNLAVILAHGCQNPGRGQDTIEKKYCENWVAKSGRFTT
jgi:hypothetical protein